MRTSFVLAALAGQSAVLAFPWMHEDGLHALLNHPEARAEIQRRLEQHHTEKRDTGIIEGVTSLLGGTLTAVVDSVLGLLPTDDAVDGLTRFPEGKTPLLVPTHLLCHISNLYCSQMTTLFRNPAILTSEALALV